MATYNWGAASEYDEELKLTKSREEFICDSREDIEAINTENLLSGSLVLCPPAGTIYSLSDGTWYNVKDPTDTISGGGPGPEPGEYTLVLDSDQYSIVMDEQPIVTLSIEGLPAGYYVDMPSIGATFDPELASATATGDMELTLAGLDDGTCTMTVTLSGDLYDGDDQQVGTVNLSATASVSVTL